MVKERLAGVAHSKDQNIGVMFFGTLEIACLAPARVTGWLQGVQQRFYTKAKHRKSFHKAVEQAHILHLLFSIFYIVATSHGVSAIFNL